MFGRGLIKWLDSSPRRSPALGSILKEHKHLLRFPVCPPGELVSETKTNPFPVVKPPQITGGLTQQLFTG